MEAGYSIEKELSNALMGWYPFDESARILWIADENTDYEGIYEFLINRGFRIVRCTHEDLLKEKAIFDYILMVGSPETSKAPSELLIEVKKHLLPTGKLLLAANNRLGIRYFCGDKDIYTGHVLDGIDCYGKVSSQRKEKLKGRAYSKNALREMLLEAGFQRQRFYSVMPSIERPQILLAEGYVPNESLAVRVFPQYNSPQTVFLEEEKLYDDLLKNGLFDAMANGFLIECSVEGELTDADQITVSGDRGHEHALATVIKKDAYVYKKALYPEGENKIPQLLEHTAYLKEHGVPVVDAAKEGTSLVMPYVGGKLATVYFRELLKSDRRKFKEELTKFRELILRSSEALPYEEVNWQHFDPEWEKRKADDPNLNRWQELAYGTQEERNNIGVILKRGYIDLVSLNCFYTDQGFLFFDQEFYVDTLPANVILMRTIDLIYRDEPQLEEILKKDELLKEFSLYEHRELWRRYTNVFMRKLRCERELSAYHKQVRRDGRVVAANRHRMDYTQEEYERLFTNVFKNVAGKKLYLFGAGRFSEQFIRQFRESYEIAGIVDNDCSKWGTMLEGIPVASPESLKAVEEPFKVLICIKFYDGVLEQLKAMGIMDMSVYDPSLEYERPLKHQEAARQGVCKRYHVGYVAGVFDLFHIGHLNLLQRAKEQSDYLIVGVVSDEQVIRDKRTSPYIPFEERRRIVEACRYVDEAVRIPEDAPGTEAAYRRYHFDVQFSGSDYAKDPDWLAKQVFLRQHGSDLVFFPYTESTSSTKLKGTINKQ